MRFNLSLRAVVLATTLLASAGFAAHHAMAAGSSMGSDMGGASAPSGSGANPQESYNAGIAALQSNDYRTAIRRFREVLDVAPRDGMANYYYGLALIGNSQQANARRPLERATNDRNAPADAYLQLTRVYLGLNDREHAQATQVELTQAIAQCDAACGDARRAELQATLTAVDAALAAPPAAPAAPTTGWLPPGEGAAREAYARGQAFVNEQRYAEAFAQFSEARRAIGPNADVLNYLGFTSRHLGRTDEALAYYREALTLNPGHRGATEYLGELYLQLGRRAEANQMLARLDLLCPYSCAEREELQRWIVASN